MTLTAESRVESTGAPLPASVDVAVIGSGFAGLATAVRLKQDGRDFVVLERGDDVGGTWRDNSYPGCACDVPSHLYSFSFAPNPDWSRAFSPQEEIYDYLRRTADDYGLLPHIRFGTGLLEAQWDGRRWQIRTTAGDLSARILVSGAGALSEPAIPTIPGLDTFAGTTFHSASWRHDHDLTGERIAVIGTGASAIQFVPQIQPVVDTLTVFQRTPPWVMPRRDRDISRVERWLYRKLPFTQRLARAGIYSMRETWVLGFAFRPSIMKLGERTALRYLHKEIRDPALRAKLTPSYRLGCKRVLLSSDYFPALNQPNVDVVTDHIVEVLPHAVVTVDQAGARTEHPTDTIIFGTGFRVTDHPLANSIRDADGRTLAEHWSNTGMTALHGMSVAGFPNLFWLVGPNTGLGHTSIVYIIESQVRYLVDALRTMTEKRVHAVEPRRDVQDAWNAKIQAGLAGTVWNAGGCSSWYLDSAGRNTTLWPTFTFTFRRELSSFDLSDYVKYADARAGATTAA